MITVTNDYKIALTQPRNIDAKIIVGLNTIDSSSLNQISRNIYSGLFKTVMKQVVIDSNTTIVKDTTIEPKFGLYVNNAFEYISLGTYKTNKDAEMNKDTKSYQIYAYDKIVESMVSYELTTSDITYPCSVRDLIVAIFTKLGWTTSGIPATFTNSTSQIEEDVYSNANMTYRGVLDELMTISCRWLVDKNGTPTMITPTTTSATIDEEYMCNTNVEIKENVFFNSLVFSRASESDNIYRKDDASITANGLHEFKISDCQLLSLNWRDNFIDAMWNYIKTFNYYAYDINTIGITYLDAVDNYTLSINSSTYNTLLLNSELVINQGLKERIFADTPEETETEYKYADTTDKKINQTNLTVDKQNQQITAVASQVAEDEQKLSSLTITTDNIQANVTSTTNNLSNQISALASSTSLQINAINQTLEDGVEKLTNSLVTIDANGIKTSKDNETFNTQITNKTFEVRDRNKPLAFIGYKDSEQRTVAQIDDLESARATIGVHRCETITRNYRKRTAWFYVGGGN